MEKIAGLKIGGTTCNQKLIELLKPGAMKLVAEIARDLLTAKRIVNLSAAILEPK